MKFERSDEYMQKLFELALFDEKAIHTDVQVIIQYENGYSGKLKAYCPKTDTYLQFPRALREFNGQEYIADVVEVLRSDNVTKYYRVMKGSIRNTNSDKVIG